MRSGSVLVGNAQGEPTACAQSQTQADCGTDERTDGRTVLVDLAHSLTSNEAHYFCLATQPAESTRRWAWRIHREIESARARARARA